MAETRTDTRTTRPRARPLRQTFVPIRRSMIGTPKARAEFAQAVSALVATLAEARTLPGGLDDEPRVRALMQRARRELDLAEEKLLMLDRRRQRSIFRRADQLRQRLDDLHYRLACYYVERTFDDQVGQCQTDQQSPRS